VHGVLFPRQPVGLEQRLHRLARGSPLLLNLLRCLAYRVCKPPGMQDTRHIGSALQSTRSTATCPALRGCPSSGYACVPPSCAPPPTTPAPAPPTGPPADSLPYVHGPGGSDT